MKHSIFDLAVIIPALITGGYLIAWAIPGAIILSIISLGSLKHIIFIDKQLAKDLDKYYDNNGNMRLNHNMPYSISSRFTSYCLAYPFIKGRVKTKSVKFKFFMWINSLGYWSFWGTGFFVLLAKLMAIIP
ncbi:hypothetical protein [Vibrio cholerae]|uniref:hypothetical protein n=1 Tax=Vibrio cholerae TaxID=666 RepID=UPI0011D54A8B|nr:hypothetical protein [Vibrio cholerae]EHD2271077.1 hypothetical protein [Vibrio cholerae]EIJ2221281.1 hypothetical protein [Vibrio cholerae]EJL6998555.1 hypothetical protein [Vibrio cholerae]EKF9882628.1 hypothetical protein [Vibrio cholerae]TYA02265.1 hypothetical protein FXE48_04895 [Vibrio cholerae]